jgi:hypothetical protein
MRNIHYLLLGWAVLLLVSCGIPGGIYKEYEGPDREAKEIAILDWSSCDSCAVIRIDDNNVRVPGVSWRLRIDHAHLLPGPHTVTVRTHYEDLGKRTLDLHADVQPDRSYVVKQTACFDCDPFWAKIWIEDTGSGVKIAQRSAVGSGPYGELARERQQCRDDCDEERCQDTEEDCRANRSLCRLQCDRTYSAYVGKGPDKPTLDVSVKMPLREAQNRNLLARVQVNDQRTPEAAASAVEDVISDLPQGTITFDPPEAQIVKNLLEVELTKILREQGVQAPQDFACDLLEFSVHASDEPLWYWDVVGRIRLVLKQNGREYHLSAHSTKRAFPWANEKVIKRVVDKSLKELAADLRQRLMVAVPVGRKSPLLLSNLQGLGA